MAENEVNGDRITREELVRIRVDDKGNVWRKVYFGSGSHFRNWLEQIIELRGKDNVDVEETDARGLKCFEESGERVYRIWVRESSPPVRFT